MEFGIFALIVGSLVSIFSDDIRTWLIDKLERFRARNNESYNRKLDIKIALITDLSNSAVAAIGYAASGLFLVLLLLTLMIFFGFLLILKGDPLLTGIGFLLFWFWALIFAAYHVDICILLRNPQLAIQNLENKRRDMP